MAPLDMTTSDLFFCNLASGSKGNATYVGSEKRGVLVDMGLSVRELLRRMDTRSIPVSAIEAVVVTHEHGDHAHGVGRFAASRGIPVWINEGTAAAARLSPLPEVRAFHTGESFSAGGLTIDPVPIPHDTADPVAFVLGNGRHRAAVATDMGCPTRLVVDKLSSCALVMLEFNHDLDMLMTGSYPWNLKQRVRGRHGHLSNQQALEILEGILPGRVRRVLMAHLSEQNNLPQLALGEARAKLQALGREDVDLDLLWQKEPSPIYCITEDGIRLQEGL